MRNNNNNINSSYSSRREADGGSRGRGGGGGGGGHYRDSSAHNDRDRDNNKGNFNYDRRRQQEGPSPHRQQYNQQPYHSSRERSDQRDRSGQRDRVGQHPDSSMGRDNTMGSMGNMANLGSVKFTPGYPTRELPPIETRADASKKFTGRCRLFVGNLPHNTSEEKLRALFEPFGEIGEVFLGPKSAFAFVKMDTRQTAEAARDKLDCTIYEGRALRVRLAAHAAAIRVKHLSPQVTNELLAYAFRYFGEIERAVVVVDDKGKSTGEGIVEYSRKQSAQYAIKRCQQECFMLTASSRPVLVEAYDQQDEDEGLPEKSINRNAIEFKEQRDVGPRFAEQGSFEQTFALKWKDLYAIEKQKRDQLEHEIQEGRRNLEAQIEVSRMEHDEMQLRNKLQQLEHDRLKLQQLKGQTMTDVHLRVDEQRRQQEMLIRQRDDGMLRRQQQQQQPQQMGDDPNGLSQQDTSGQLRPGQAHGMQDMMGMGASQDVQDQTHVTDTQQKINHPSQVQIGTQEMGDQGMQVNQMMGPAPRSFADVTMMGLGQPAYIQVAPPPMGMAAQQQNPQNMFTNYIPPPPLQGSMGDNSTFGSYLPQQQQSDYNAVPPSNNNNNQSHGNGRQQKFNRQFVNQNNNITVANSGRTRKRGRFNWQWWESLDEITILLELKPQ